MKNFLVILLILGLFCASFFMYSSVVSLRIVKDLASNILTTTISELDGTNPNSAVLCINNTKYKIFIDNDLNKQFTKKDSLLFKGHLTPLTTTDTCYSIACSLRGTKDFTVILDYHLPFNFIFFSPSILVYKINFKAKSCLVSFEKY